MEAGLRLAWTEIVTADDYDSHMTTIGQAQATAALTAEIVHNAGLRGGSRLLIAGAGTGNMFNFVDADLFRDFKLICTDLNPAFLGRLRERLARTELDAFVIADDIERTSLRVRPDLLIATLLLEHIDWRAGVGAIASLNPAACGLIIQENPAGMKAAVTPGRSVPSSIAAAMERAHPELVPEDELVGALESRGYDCAFRQALDVTDGKLLIAFLFVKSRAHKNSPSRRIPS